MQYTPDEIARMAFSCLNKMGEYVFMAQLAHKHMYLFCGTASY